MSTSVLLAVVGPTASGKSALALSLAKRLGGEIVSCDSMQIYRGMDIGTAKPTPAEQAEVRHHMIDLLRPSEPFSCAEYAVRGGEAVEEILKRGALPIVCGGTGLYLDSLLLGDRFAPDIPESVTRHVAEMPMTEVLSRLRELDPASFDAIAPENEKRVRRALAIALGCGVTKSEWDERSRTLPPRYRAVILCLTHPDREVLYRRIDERVDRMMEMGLLDEVRRVRAELCATAAQAIGYKELIEHLEGRMSLADAVGLLKRNTRRYAKRQMTWFRRYPDLICLDATLPEEQLVQQAIDAWEKGRKEKAWT